MDSQPAEFSGGDARAQYDVWKYSLEHTLATGRKTSDFIATCQGFGTNPNASVYRNPTPNELRYQVFIAVVLGIDKVLFWYDGWANTVMQNLVAQTIGQIQHIGAQMNNGITNDSRIQVSVTDHNQLVYRFGTSGSEYAILAVNIANRTSSSGLTLSNVKFTLPADIKPTQVTVVDEGRTIPIDATTNSFADTFTKFQVHIYTFSANSTPTPVTIPGDANADGRVDGVDYTIWLTNYLLATNKGASVGDFNQDGKVDGVDYTLWLNSYLT